MRWRGDARLPSDVSSGREWQCRHAVSLDDLLLIVPRLFPSFVIQVFNQQAGVSPLPSLL
jgi:hypothetical protein